MRHPLVYKVPLKYRPVVRRVIRRIIRKPVKVLHRNVYRPVKQKIKRAALNLRLYYKEAVLPCIKRLARNDTIRRSNHFKSVGRGGSHRPAHKRTFKRIC